MDGRKRYLKFLVFVPAVVLVGGFIAIRAGAFELPWVSKPAPQPEPQPEVQPTAPVQPPTPPTAPPNPSPEAPTFMGGSKSLILAEPGSLSDPPNSPNPPGTPPAIIYGSKSGPIILPWPPPNPGPQQGTPRRRQFRRKRPSRDRPLTLRRAEEVGYSPRERNPRRAAHGRAEEVPEGAGVRAGDRLGRGFIGCQSGALRLFSKPEPKPDPHPTGTNTPVTQLPAPEDKPVFMNGTKSLNNKGITIGLTPAGTNTSGVDVPVRQPPAPPAPEPERKPQLIIPGPKSGPIFTPPDQPKP